MPNDFDRVARKIESLADDIPETANETVDEQLFKLRADAQTNLSANDTDWRGLLHHSMRVDTVARESGHLRHTLSVEAPYAAYVEFGTGSYFNNEDPSRDVRHFDAPALSDELFENIYEWVKTKPVTPRHYATKRGLAWAISSTIAELGTKAQPFIRPAYHYRKPLLVDDVRRSLKKKLRSL